MSVTYQLARTGQKRHAEWQFPASPQALARLLRRYNLDPIRVAAAADGTENQTFIVTCRRATYALRVYRQYKKSTAEIMAEVEFTRWLAGHGIPVPRVLSNARGREVTETVIDGVRWQSLLMEHVPGEHPQTLTKPLVRELARLQARIHQLGSEYAAGQGGRLLYLGLPCGYSHFDIACYNLLVQGGHITAILDFDDMGFGPLADCLATALVRIEQLANQPKLQAYYLAEYQRVRPLGQRERLHIKGRLLLRRPLPTIPSLRLWSSRRVYR